MHRQDMHMKRNLSLIVVAMIASGPWMRGTGVAGAQAAHPETFATPDEAKQAVVSAAKAKDRAALDRIFGAESALLLSGDSIEDAKDLDDFAAGAQEGASLEKKSDAQYVLIIGNAHYPFPVPIAKEGDRWAFDMKAGTEEMLNRRIGENELSAIATSRAYAVAQWEYYTEADWNRDGVAEYAERLVSTAGQHDGLYWETAPEAKLSPLGPLVAAARTEGYPNAAKAGTSTDAIERTPYHGYYFKILTAQGPHAPGGKYSYLINGHMIGGYALVAYPADWGQSGVMSFIINQQGRVYEKNLGPKTSALAAAMTTYEPDRSWKMVIEP